ncbi:hypothetical protein niasHS_009841 [Heterodera schachtii]|uniref:Uncharacterized protein n=1 Tax=Heterodera schachtii TaxID=97005 RepID=A0ABD2JAH5_HETSC
MLINFYSLIGILPAFLNAQVLFLNTTTLPFVTFYPAGDLKVFRIGDHQNLNVSLWTANSTPWLGDVFIDCEPKIGCPLESLNESMPILEQSVQLDRSNNFSHFFNLSLRGSTVGINRLNVLIHGKKWIQNFAVRTRKTKSGSTFTLLFTKSLTIAIVLGNFLAGIQLNSKQIFANFLHNLCFMFATIVCQFLINPMIGFFIANYVLFHQPFVVRLSFFMVTSIPAGVGKSNFWTVIFGGDLPSAGLITFAQRIGTLLSMPLWLRFVGKKFFVNRVTISNAFVWHATAIVLVPFLVGMLCNCCCPGRERFNKISGICKFFFCLCTLLFLCAAILANLALFWPLFHHLDLLLCSALLFPLFAHLSALLIGFILRLSPVQRTTLAVENGVPSIGLAMLLMLWSMGEPEKDVAMMAPIGMALLAEKPLLLLCIAKICYRTFKRDTIGTDRGQETTDVIKMKQRKINEKAEQNQAMRGKEIEGKRNEREI